MARATLKQGPELLVRHFPKGFDGEMASMHPDDVEKLERVQASKVKPSVRNTERKYRDGEPSAERVRHADRFYGIGGDNQVGKKYTMMDSPLDRMRARNAIDPVEYSALRKYAHHWYHGGLLSSVSSVDLNRVFAADPLSMSGMAKSEGQAHHRQQYRQAREILGHRPGIVVDNVVCAEWPLHVAGHAIGYDSPYRARRAATEILRDAGYRLARLWGIG